MPSVQGVVKCQGKQIVGNFDINLNGASDSRQLVVEVNTRTPTFECKNATLTYGSVAQLSGVCNWSGEIGMHDIRMDFGEGINIAGQTTVPLRSSTQTGG